MEEIKDKTSSTETSKESKKSGTFQLRMPPDIKAEIRKKSDMAGVSMSAYMIECSTSPDKVVILNKGGDIAKSLTEISIYTERALRGNDITTELECRLLTVLEEVSYKFSKILDKVTLIRCEEESEVDG